MLELCRRGTEARIRTFWGKTDNIDCLGVLAKRRQVLHASLLSLRINPPELADSQHGTFQRGERLHTLTLLSPPAVASLLPLGSKWAEYIGALESCQLTMRGALFMVWTGPQRRCIGVSQADQLQRSCAVLLSCSWGRYVPDLSVRVRW